MLEAHRRICALWLSQHENCWTINAARIYSPIRRQHDPKTSSELRYGPFACSASVNRTCPRDIVTMVVFLYIELVVPGPKSRPRKLGSGV